MILRGQRQNVCVEDRATLESDLSAAQGIRKAVAPTFILGATLGNLIDVSCFLSPKAKTPGAKRGTTFHQRSNLEEYN